ncbi:cell envelope integrity protein TolA [Rappaport israeli]|uniref:cell envelope integrity protein TolA n=1 Tax=Rappaport israeli TaxID=1839807 RepID=UPI0009305523|nr:cell envelope integrity protein TolA [Rappaport israeli]
MGLALSAMSAFFWSNRDVVLSASGGSADEIAQTSEIKAIEATVVDAAQLQAQFEAIEQRKIAEEKARLAAIAKAEAEKKAAQEEAKRQAEAAKQAKIEAQKAKEEALAAERQAQAERAKNEKIAQEKKAAEQKAQAIAKEKAQLEAKQKVEAEARQKAEKEAKAKAEKEAKAKAEEEAKRKAEQAKKQAEAEAKKKAEEEAKKKAEAEAKKKAEEKRKAEEAAAKKLAELDQPSLGDTLNSLNDGAEKAKADALKNFIGAFGNKMKSRWKLLPNVPNNIKVELFVRFAPNGQLTEVRVTRSSGNYSADAAAVETAYASAPAPMPRNQEAAQLLVKEGAIIVFTP